jgi:cell division protein FtsN
MDGSTEREDRMEHRGSQAAADELGDEPPTDGPSRRLPVLTIAVLCIALILLAVGGYGVVQQRGEMQSEIRDLRAQLATTITPEEAAAERERQRQVELENESLSAELEGLTAENRELADRLTSMEAAVADREARAASAAAERARLANLAAQRASPSRAAPGSGASAGAAAAPGTWFVNFGSYAQRNVADRWAAQLEVEAGSVGVRTATAAGKTLYRVRVLGLSDRDTAERIATSLERKYQLPRLWVGQSE